MRFRRGKDNGFNLLELGMVIAITAILFGVVILRARSARRWEPIRRCQSHARQIGMALDLYSTDHGGWLPYADGSPDPSASLALLYPETVSASMLFRCPVTDIRPRVEFVEIGGARLPRFEETPYGSSYGYDRRVNPRKVGPDHAVLADMDGTGPVDPDSTTTNHPGGQNVLYLDGHVEWRTTNAGSDNLRDNIYTAEAGWDPDTDSCVKRTVGD